MSSVVLKDALVSVPFTPSCLWTDRALVLSVVALVVMRPLSSATSCAALSNLTLYAV